jgi:TPP-dependent pyruvate/acetoin dehydrogenase alpha subunit
MATAPAGAARPSEALSRDQLLEMYYFARLAREIEERLVILFRQSKVIGGLYRRKVSPSRRPTPSIAAMPCCR